MKENESYDFLGASDAEHIIFAMEEENLREEENLVKFSEPLFKTHIEDRSELAELYPDQRFSTEDLKGYDLYCIVDGMYMNVDSFSTKDEARKSESLFRLRLEKKLKENIKSAFNHLH
tara:strand:- start:208 stop:561 length:354 start_codon:yes stop_codon:yes gene_type:complete